MFNNEGMFGKRDDATRAEPRSTTNAYTSVNARSTVKPQAPSQPDPDNAAAAPDVQGRGNTLVVGPNIKMKGVEVTDCDTVIVEGQIEATLDSRLVLVRENGLFTGTAGMDVAEIWGSFEGELTARQHLIIHPTGRVSGYIRYGKIRVEEGGEISGEVSTLAAGPGDSNTVTAREPQAKAAASAAAAASAQTGKAGAKT